MKKLNIYCHNIRLAKLNVHSTLIMFRLYFTYMMMINNNKKKEKWLKAEG